VTCFENPRIVVGSVRCTLDLMSTLPSVLLRHGYYENKPDGRRVKSSATRVMREGVVIKYLSIVTRFVETKIW
jgi:hypothetical protein